MHQEHEIVKTPDESTVIWRYMDLFKFLSLIKDKKLAFPSALKLSENDPYEGSFTEIDINYDPIKDLYLKDLKLAESLKRVLPYVRLSMKEQRKGIYINSWYMNPHESYAMWNLYSKEGQGIAIKSTIKSFKNSLKDVEENIYIGSVNYIDYEKDSLISTGAVGNVFIPFINKRKSFEHEKEVRAIVWDADTLLNPEKQFKDIIFLDLNINELIQEIYISPSSPDWVVSIIENICSKYELNKPVIKSKIFSEGLW